MNKKVRISMISLAIVMLILSVSTYFFYFSKENSDQNKISDTSKIEINNQPEESLSSEETIEIVKENKYYVIYVNDENGSGSSFVPEKLNPDFKNNSDFAINISFDDNGNIINDEKIIEIDNFVISSQNKKEIKEIAGVKNYDEALKEIEDGVLESKKNMEIEESKE